MRTKRTVHCLVVESGEPVPFFLDAAVGLLAQQSEHAFGRRCFAHGECEAVGDVAGSCAGEDGALLGEGFFGCEQCV